MDLNITAGYGCHISIALHGNMAVCASNAYVVCLILLPQRLFYSAILFKKKVYRN